MVTFDNHDFRGITFQEFRKDPGMYINLPPVVWIAKSGKNKLCYQQVYCGFDIETYTYINKYGYMYIWQFSIYTKQKYIVYGRTWSEFVEFISILKDILALSSTCRLLVFIGNMGFEFQFIKRWLSWSKIFARERRQPIYAIHDDCIEFRDALMITGGSLKQLAKDYTKTQKLDGDDLDYSKPRTWATKIPSEDFTLKNLEYCLCDVAILSEYAEYLFNTYIIPEKWVPLTKTGLLRREVKKGIGKNRDIKSEIQRCYPKTFDFYSDIMQYLFRGGYVHTNVLHAGRKISGLRARDITSSYPFTMLSYGGFPVSPFERVNPADFWELYHADKYCMIIDVTFTNLQATTPHSIESSSKCVTIPKNSIIDNGRVRFAPMVEVYLTELDFTIYELYYKKDSMVVNNLWIAKRGYLPRYLVKPIAKAYESKARMKHDGLAGTTEYNLQKSLVNSGFGMCCTRLQRYEVKMSQINYEWYLDGSGFNYDEEKKKAFLLPQWGVWVCAYSRYRLLTALHGIGDDGCYCDTDSIKYVGKHERYFEMINKHTADTMRATCERLDLPYNLFYDLGQFEPEYGGREVTGKFLGAKRYIITDGDKTEVTIAGLPKGSLQRYCEEHKADIYDVFNDGMLMDVEVSCKNAHTYTDAPHHDIINGVPVAELSSCGIFPIDFTMKIKDYYMALIKMYAERDQGYENRIY